MKKRIAAPLVLALAVLTGLSENQVLFFADFQDGTDGVLTEDSLAAGTATGRWSIGDAQESYIESGAGGQRRVCFDFGPYGLTAEPVSPAALSNGAVLSFLARGRRGGAVKTSMIRLKNESGQNLLSLRFVPDGTAPIFQLFDSATAAWIDLGAVQANQVQVPGEGAMDSVEVRLGAEACRVFLNGAVVSKDVPYANPGRQLSAVEFSGEHKQSGIWYDDVQITAVAEDADDPVTKRREAGSMQTRRDFIKTAVGSAAAVSTAQAFSVTLSGKTPPNIIFVLSDTHRYNAMSFTSEFVGIKTPNMDRMRSEGVSFLNCFSTYPCCSPYRAMMQTGRWAWQTGHIDNHMDLQFRMDQPENMADRQRNATLGYMFSNAGYRALHVGKWHQGLDQNAQPAGYESSWIWPGEAHEELRMAHNGLPWACPPYDDLLNDGSGLTYSGVPAAGRYPAFPTHPYKIIGETDQALGLIQQHDFSRKPLFVVLALQDPHAPFEYDRKEKWPLGKWDEVEFAISDYSDGRQPGRPNHPPHTLDAYNPLEIGFYPYDETREDHREKCWHYYASVTATDDELGRVLDAVDALPPPVRENTIVIYTSDHGGMNGQYGKENGSKQYPNDASSHVPFLAWGPGLIQNPGRECDALISGIDMFPTLCGLAGVSDALRRSGTPDAFESLAYLESLDGVDHSRNILSGDGPDPESVLVYNLSNCFGGVSDPIHRSVITKEYLYSVQGYWRDGNKHIGFSDWSGSPGEWLLFDRKNDRYEQNNLIDDPSFESVRVRMRTLLQEWLEKSERPEWVARFLGGSHYAPYWRDEQAERAEKIPFDLKEMLSAE